MGLFSGNIMGERGKDVQIFSCKYVTCDKSASCQMQAAKAILCYYFT